MATEITTRGRIPSATPQADKSLSQQGLYEHREAIAFEVKVILSAYFQPHEAEEIKAAQIAWWCDELQEWTREQVLWGLRSWNRENPRLRPTPGDIVAIMKAARGRKIAKQIATLPTQQSNGEGRERVSKEAAAEIMRKAGFSPSKVKGFDL